jgi:hypothetical protein
MRCDLFTDPRYHAETHFELDVSQVIATEEKTVKLFMGGSHRVTQVTMRSGEVLLIKGEVARKIEAARRNISKA